MFGYEEPNYNPLRLAELICKWRNWHLSKVYFYTGVHKKGHNEKWHDYWSKKLAQMRRFKSIEFEDANVDVIKRDLKRSQIYDNGQPVSDRNGKPIFKYKEKGIDIRIALDMVRLARIGTYDVGLLFSQDSDFEEVVREVKTIARQNDRWIKLACAFPSDGKQKGINQIDWIPIYRKQYDECLDRRNYQ